MKTCTKCGETKALDCFYTDKHRNGGRASRCKTCKRADGAAWRKANPEYMAAWARANPEKVKELGAAWRKANPEYMAAWRKANPEYMAAWERANPERVRESGGAWAKANPERVKESSAAWRKANPERWAAWAKANPEKVKALNIAYVVGLGPGYVANVLGIPVAKLTPELLELKREQLVIRRLSREIKNTLKSLKEKT